MHSRLRYMASLLVTAALVAPVAIQAAPAPQVQVRVYDKDHKDYHNWDDNENRAWNQYLSDNHKQPHDFKKAKKSEQSEYWNWRHDHPDTNKSDDRKPDDRR
jgi:hypothetical protein